MTTPQITPPGAPPDPLAPQPTFRATFYAYLQQLVAAFGEANTAFSWMNTTAETVATNTNTATSAASTATTKAAEAATSATASQVSATAAAGSATTAAEQVTLATTQANNAAASLSSFRDVYLGEAESDPTENLNSDPLTGGEFYFNTTSNAVRLYSGGQWWTAVFDPSGALVASNNLSDVSDPAAARVNLGVQSVLDAAVAQAGAVARSVNSKAFYFGSM